MMACGGMTPVGAGGWVELLVLVPARLPFLAAAVAVAVVVVVGLVEEERRGGKEEEEEEGRGGPVSVDDGARFMVVYVPVRCVCVCVCKRW